VDRQRKQEELEQQLEDTITVCMLLVAGFVL